MGGSRSGHCRFRRRAAATGGARDRREGEGLEGLTHGERWRRRAGGGMVGAPRASHHATARDRVREPQPLGKERSVEPRLTVSGLGA